MFVVRPMSDDRALRIFTAPEATNTGPGFNRGFGGGARGCGFGERVGAYARTEGGVISYCPRCLSATHRKGSGFKAAVGSEAALNQVSGSGFEAAFGSAAVAAALACALLWVGGIRALQALNEADVNIYIGCR